MRKKTNEHRCFFQSSRVTCFTLSLYTRINTENSCIVPLSCAIYIFLSRVWNNQLKNNKYCNVIYDSPWMENKSWIWWLFRPMFKKHCCFKCMYLFENCIYLKVTVHIWRNLRIWYQCKMYSTGNEDRDSGWLGIRLVYGIKWFFFIQEQYPCNTQKGGDASSHCGSRHCGGLHCLNLINSTKTDLICINNSANNVVVLREVLRTSCK